MVQDSAEGAHGNQKHICQTEYTLVQCKGPAQETAMDHVSKEMINMLPGRRANFKYLTREKEHQGIM